MTKRRPYPSDLSDARWESVEPVLSARRLERRSRALNFGRPPEHELRDIMDAISYVDRTGVQWRYLPHDFPPWNTVYGYFAKWADEGCSPSSMACSGSCRGRRKAGTASRRRM
jgi:transposase